ISDSIADAQPSTSTTTTGDEKNNDDKIIISSSDLMTYDTWDDPTIKLEFETEDEATESHDDEDSKEAAEQSRLSVRQAVDPLENRFERSRVNEKHADTYESFGRLVSAELRKYDPQTLAHVKKAIMDIIFQADIGKFP
ncbi:unnamed protein product, partial [Leptidea sinapis]